MGPAPVRRWKRIRLAAAFALAGCAGPGDVAATPQRPTFSSDTSTTARGTFELEAGVTNDPGGDLDTPTTLKYGAGESTEVFVGWSPYVKLERPGTDARGGGDVLVGTRHRFWRSDDGQRAAAVQGSVQIPTAGEASGIGDGETDVYGAGILTGALAAWSWTAFYQLGVLGEQDSSGYDLQHGLALCLARPVHEQVAVFGELAWTGSPEVEDELFSTLGFTWSPRPSTVWDLGLVVDLDDDDLSDTSIVFGVTQNLGRP